MKLCESCEKHQVMFKLKDVYGERHNKAKTYNLCANCLHNLTHLALSPEQYKNLLKNGHQADEYFIHSDFYDESGNALQPRW